MKTVLSLLLCLSLLGIFPLSAIALQQQAQASAFLNKDVLDMSMARFSDDVIIAKIRSSSCHFDTGPSTLKELKSNGVSDAVIRVMIEAPDGMSSSRPSNLDRVPSGSPNASAEVNGAPLNITDGTEIEVQLKNNISGQDANVGDLVDFTVLRPVQINGVTVFDAGASARARVTTAKRSGRWGKAGKLEWAMQDVQAVDGTRVPARFTKRLVGDSSGGTVAVAAIATTVLLGPLGLLWGLKKGKAAIIPAGNRYSVFVQGDMTVKTVTVN